ncbi:hypothetical protein MMC21_004256 [Puttea exsequens]|nr:hypothetical protein [Puttea exsequens]
MAGEGHHHAASQQQRPKDLEAALALLKKADDTSRFLGLAILKPILEQELSQSNGNSPQDESILVYHCWAAIPANFLTRLLKAKPNDKRSKEEARNMVAVAVAILHSFWRLLEYPQEDAKFLKQVSMLSPALGSCAPETTAQIMDMIHSLVMTPESSSAIFESDAKGLGEQKPPAYLFMTQLLIDIRASIPSLQEKLHSLGYPEISTRLTRAYDIVSAFISFLIRNLEQIVDNGAAPTMPVDLLMRLRTNISESISLTIEYLRDRYDSSTAGAAGLHPSARSTNGQSSQDSLLIAWDTSQGMFEDPLTIAQMRAMSLWLRDEENDALRREAASIMDVFVAAYQLKDIDNEFQSPVLIALQGVIETSAGIEAFLRETGWDVLTKDLTHIAAKSNGLGRGIEVVRVLLAVLESGETGPSKEEWISFVSLANKCLEKPTDEENLEFGIAVGQLAVEILTRAPRRLRTKNRDQVTRLLNRVKMLSNGDYADEGISDGLEEVIGGLQSLDASRG